jgi:signal transduction histidine kinase
MSGQILLDWLALAVSLFNTFLLFWLGLVVLFNTERRSLGVLVAAGGLVIGGVFFLSHSIILSQGVSNFLAGFNFWWHAGWLPVIAAPYAWYLLMLWYSGYWDENSSMLRRRQRVWFWFVLFYNFALLLLLSSNPLPNINPDGYFEPNRLPGYGFIPLQVLFYPPYAVLVISLALDALLRPAPSGRILGDLARRRARPWLVGASAVLLFVALLLGIIFMWLIQYTWVHPTIAELLFALSTTLSVFDLLLALLLMGAVLLLGQALVSYEVFTGQSLPRRGFLLQWRETILWAAVFGSLGSWAVTAALPSIYLLIGALLLVALAFAMHSWRSFAGREFNVRQLRPFVGSQRLLENILTPAQSSTKALEAPLVALFRDLLGARSAALVPLGSLASLYPAPLYYPADASFELPDLTEILKPFTTPKMLGQPLDSTVPGGLVWAAPLWSERGLVGLLLLGEKQDGGLYSLEEIEIARAGGERLVDILASAELARRLVALQRQRLAQSSVLDRRARRVLHDEVLPRLHTALLQLSALPAAREAEKADTLQVLSAIHRQISNLLRDLPAAAAPDVSRLGLAAALQQTLEHEFPEAFDEVIWLASEEAVQKLDALPPIFAEVVFFAAREAFRNAARHGRSLQKPQLLSLRVQVACDPGATMTIEDNGVGFGSDRLLSEPIQDLPFSNDGSGQGLALHSTLIAVIGGSLIISSQPGQYTRLTIALPDSLWEN